jgi:hypothetical protein
MPTRRERRQASFALTLAVVVLGVFTGAAVAAVGLGQATKFRARFSTQHTKSASGLTLRTTGRAPDVGTTEAPAVRQTVVFPKGTQLRLRALPQCRASDSTIAAEGAEAVCPAKTRVGTGGADGVLTGKPVHFDIGIYAVRGRLVFAAEQGGKPLRQSFLGVARGTSLQLSVPTLNGSIAPTGFNASIRARPGGKGWLRTPSQCPKSGHWTATGRFQGVSSAAPGASAVTPAQTLTDRLPCHQAEPVGQHAELSSPALSGT